MGLKTFDRKFGKEFLASIPPAPGVYRIYDTEGCLIYVGKAKNLRRRLSQYRNAKRRRKHRKMQSIVADAARIEPFPCQSELEACLLEARLIQENRPKWNVDGAFSFLYPLMGIRVTRPGQMDLCFTSKPEECEGFSLHGAYRSRHISGEAFFAWMRLLQFIGHRLPGKARLPGTRSYVFGFRGMPLEWEVHWDRFLRGESREALEDLAFALLENAGARKRRTQVEEDLKALDRFWRHEARRLALARERAGIKLYPVPQSERDLIFIRSRFVARGGNP